jgi:uncharacterized repeat protein (TIGR03803 family)
MRFQHVAPRHLICLLTYALLLVRPARAQVLTTLYSFAGRVDGSLPAVSLIDAEGNLYGATPRGGILKCGGHNGCGTVFKVTSEGTKVVLHEFRGGKSGDGKFPNPALILDGSGNVYGTTYMGGDKGRGAVFQITPDGSESVLYSFGGPPDGAFPGALVQDGNGNFYGTTAEGGSHHFGTVFVVTADGQEKGLFSFDGKKKDGKFPGDLILDASGNFYGTTSYGGNCEGAGCGLMFEVNTNGTQNILWRFSGTDGSQPGSLIWDEHGNLYGTTYYGGTFGYGTVFELSPVEGGSWSLTVLYSFIGGEDAYPDGTLVRDTEGNLYGTATGSGINCENHSCGEIFQITPTGTAVVLHTFAWWDGAVPWGDLLRDDQGSLYGATQLGGTYGYGTVFKLTP